MEHCLVGTYGSGPDVLKMILRDGKNFANEPIGS